MNRPQTHEHDDMHRVVEGCLIPDAWDRNFTVTGVIIACQDEQEYRVLNVHEHQGLLAACHRLVQAKGTVQRKNGLEYLKISAFKLREEA